MSPASSKHSKHLTLGGYLKADVYRELQDAVLHKNYERACYLTAELACTPSETRLLLNFFVQLYAERFLSSNVWVLETLHGHLQQAAALARKKSYAQNESFQKHVCQLVLIVSQEQQRTIAFPRQQEATACDGAAIADRYGDQVPPAAACKLGAMLLHVVRGDAQGALGSLHAVLDGASAAGPAPFEFVRHLGEAQRKDVAWYVWDVLLTESRKSNVRLVRQYVHHALALYLFGYQKKVRATRLNYLFYALFVLTQKKAKLADRSTALTRRATKTIHIVFSETLGLPAHRLDYLQYVTMTNKP